MLSTANITCHPGGEGGVRDGGAEEGVLLFSNAFTPELFALVHSV